MKELKEKLNELISKMEEIKSLASCKSENAYLWKKIEDGILENVHRSNPTQQRNLHNYKFRFYTEFNKKDVLESFIKSKVREERLRKLLEK